MNSVTYFERKVRNRGKCIIYVNEARLHPTSERFKDVEFFFSQGQFPHDPERRRRQLDDASVELAGGLLRARPDLLLHDHHAPSRPRQVRRPRVGVLRTPFQSADMEDPLQVPNVCQPVGRITSLKGGKIAV